ncbi:beta-lactamase-like protein [Cladorrhinum sp. PSN259]|nr:beta-lactamase-like protein [Cladorrhinum sp. PSN259]
MASASAPVKKESRGGYKQINKALNVCAFEDYMDAQQAALPVIADVEQISPRVLRVLGQNAGKFTLQGTNTYIVGTGPRRLIIDTAQGLPEYATILENTLSENNIALSHVLLTHWHGDHAGGVPDILRLYPDLNNAIYKHTPTRTQQPIADGQIFKVDDETTVRAVHAPGHSHDHMCFILEEENAMFTGDNVLGHGATAVEQLSTWMNSMKVMQSHGCTTGYPAHGTVITDLKGKINWELATKTRREKRILTNLTAIKKAAPRGTKGSVTVKELVTKMHGEGLDPQVRAMAVEPFTEEVLRKLAEDGKVAFEVRGGEKKWFGIESS